MEGEMMVERWEKVRFKSALGSRERGRHDPRPRGFDGISCVRVYNFFA